MENVKLSGFILLFTGVAVLLFTCVLAFQLLMGFEDILGSSDLINLFGEALAPLISYAIRALYLGIMGWIGSILTRRGVQIITATPQIIHPVYEDPSTEVGVVEQPDKKSRKTPRKTLKQKQDA